MTKAEIYWNSLPLWARIEKFPNLDIEKYGWHSSQFDQSDITALNNILGGN